MSRQCRSVTLAILFLALAAWARAQTIRGVVVDQTGLPLPGATVQLLSGPTTVATITTGPDGSFVIDDMMVGDTIVASLEGFEQARVSRDQATRIVLVIARTSETTTVVASTIADASPTAALLGSTLTATNIARLPSTRMKARESLPLLPSVVRGPDGLMQIGGARAYETPIVLDGFNVTDPATGLSTLNLPFEAVRGIDALRDPMSVSYGRLIGGVVKMETTPGGDRFVKGVQGFIPRPRLSTPDFGRIESALPRAYVGGSLSAGRIRYFGAAEYDYERVTVPDVTSSRGSAVTDQSAVGFMRVDVQVSPRYTVTAEGFVFPNSTGLQGLSPRRDETATVDRSGVDVFGGVTHRFVQSQASVLTLQMGALTHHGRFLPNGQGTSTLTPDGWTGNWFATARRNSGRYNLQGSWEHINKVANQVHDVTIGGELAYRTLDGDITEGPVVVRDSLGRTMRTVEFGPGAQLNVHDVPMSAYVRDVWRLTQRLQIDGGVRIDGSSYAPAMPSARVGARYDVDSDARTVLKVGAGTFVGNIALMVPAFGSYPTRIDREYDPTTGAVIQENRFQPTTGALRFPNGTAATVGLEHQFMPGLDGQITATVRHTANVATLNVPPASGALTVASNGAGNYHDVQLSIRRLLGDDQQVFVSYVRAYAEGDLNDFAAMSQAVDSPIVLPNDRARLPTDARHRVLTWGTFNMPMRMVISPVVEWRSGFPYSTFDPRYSYMGAPNSRQFPAFVSADMIVYKTFTVKERSADIGVQVFNLTNHGNPRDVYSIAGSSRFGEFTNSVGPVVRGYMLLKW